MITSEQIEKFIMQAHRVGDAGLTVCSSGNLSWRIGEEALVSGTGSWVPSLTKEKVAVCRVADGEVLNGVKPSMESGFHLGVLRERPDVDVVLHFQSPYATAVYEGDSPKLQRDGGGALPRGERDTRDSLFPSRFTRVGGAGEGSSERP